MLIVQFILENLHFAINLFAALVFFAVAWLYLDAFLETKSKKQLVKIFGFLLLSFSFLINSAYIEQSVLTNALFSDSLIQTLTNSAKFLAYIFLIVGLFLDPIEKKPTHAEQNSEKPAVNVQIGFFSMGAIFNSFTAILVPIFSLGVFFLYLRRATIGLENHLKPLTFGFFFIFLYEVFSLSRLFEHTANVSIYKIVEPFGPIWILDQLFLLVGILIIAKWVFGYLLKRIESEIFMIFNVLILVIFLITTLVFTGLLLKSLEDDAIAHLNTDVNVVSYAISTKQSSILSDAELVAENPEVQNAITQKNRDVLRTLATTILIAKKETILIVLSSSGQVLMRGEDSEKIGDSLSDDALFVRAVRGEKASSVVTKDGPIAPIVSLRSAVPVILGGQVIGVIIAGTDIDSAFVDGLKSSTKLDVSVYGGNTLSATTFIAADGKSRFIGAKEENKQIGKNVLIEGKNYSGELSILNVPYFVSFEPLKDVNGTPVGMLFVGTKQVSVIQAASRAIEYTFVISAFFLLLSIIPIFLISRFITNQIR